MRCIIAFEVSIVETCVIPLLGVWRDVEHIAGIDNEMWYEYEGQIAKKIQNFHRKFERMDYVSFIKSPIILPVATNTKFATVYIYM